MVGGIFFPFSKLRNFYPFINQFVRKPKNYLNISRQSLIKRIIFNHTQNSVGNTTAFVEECLEWYVKSFVSGKLSPEPIQFQWFYSYIYIYKKRFGIIHCKKFQRTSVQPYAYVATVLSTCFKNATPRNAGLLKSTLCVKNGEVVRSSEYHPTDHGQITELSSEVKTDVGVDVIEAVADKGYQSPEDMSKALENGVVPNVIQRDGETEVTVDFEYNPAESTELNSSSTSPDDVKKCLQAGTIPDVYGDILSNPEIISVKSTEYTISDDAVLKMTQEQMVEDARKGYLIRDPHRNLVICPEGAILRQKSIKRNGDIRYCNKLACKHCKNKCTKSPFREADFSKDKLVMKVKGYNHNDNDKPDTGIKVSKKVVTTQKVRFRFKLDEKKMNERECLSEHPFGTVKRVVGMSYLLLKGKTKVIGETALMYLSYNLRRAISIKGVEDMVKALA
mgnify:CR=1 FL=1